MSKAAELPAGMLPRGLTRDQAAVYLGLTVRQFTTRVRNRHLPAPIPGSQTWDRAALDALLDQTSGLVRPAAGGGSADDVYEAWKSGHAG